VGALSKLTVLVIFVFSLLSSQKSDTSFQVANFSSFLENHPDVPEVQFNAGFEAFQNGELEQAQRQFNSTVESGNLALLFPSLYNLGNTLYSKADQTVNAQENPQSQPPSYDEAVQAYRKALSLNPTDENAKFNYELALKRMLEQTPQEQNQKQQQDQSEDNSDEQKKLDQQQSQNEKNDQQKPEQSPNQQNKSIEEKQGEQKSSPHAISQTEERPDSEAILDALRAQEKLQPKLFIDNMRSKKQEKDW